MIYGNFDLEDILLGLSSYELGCHLREGTLLFGWNFTIRRGHHSQTGNATLFARHTLPYFICCTLQALTNARGARRSPWAAFSDVLTQFPQQTGNGLDSEG